MGYWSTTLLLLQAVGLHVLTEASAVSVSITPVLSPIGVAEVRDTI